MDTLVQLGVALSDKSGMDISFDRFLDNPPSQHMAELIETLRKNAREMETGPYTFLGWSIESDEGDTDSPLDVASMMLEIARLKIENIDWRVWAIPEQVVVMVVTDQPDAVRLIVEHMKADGFIGDDDE